MQKADTIRERWYLLTDIYTQSNTPENRAENNRIHHSSTRRPLAHHSPNKFLDFQVIEEFRLQSPYCQSC